MRRRTIAWVEDDLDILRPAVLYLEMDQFEVREYRTYHEAMVKIEEIETCDIILLDLILPPGSLDVEDRRYLGLSFLEHLREERGNTTVPVIVFSIVGNGNRDVSDKVNSLGAMIMDKFVDIGELEDEVGRLISVNS